MWLRWYIRFWCGWSVATLHLELSGDRGDQNVCALYKDLGVWCPLPEPRPNSERGQVFDYRMYIFSGDGGVRVSLWAYFSGPE